MSEEIKLKFPGKITIASTPADVIRSCGVTYCMLSNLEASEAVVHRLFPSYSMPSSDLKLV